MTQAAQDVTLDSEVDDKRNSIRLSRSIFPLSQGRSPLLPAVDKQKSIWRISDSVLLLKRVVRSEIHLSAVKPE